MKHERVKKIIDTPTGHIVLLEGEDGLIEMVSLGDYGKKLNLKCQAMGPDLSRDIPKVRHTEILPLEEKWVLTLSTQYGCSMGCKFCDVPKVGAGRNISFNDLMLQVEVGLALHPEVQYSNRLNIHFARMGEPTFNLKVISAARAMIKKYPKFKIHPVVSTMGPRRNMRLYSFLAFWMNLKNNEYEGNAGLQLSINSTDEEERYRMFSGNAASLMDLALVMGRVLKVTGKRRGRKITLNFAVSGYTVEPSVLLPLFPPEDYIIKLTPMHKTLSATSNNIATEGDYTTMHPYKEIEERLVEAGYDVLVFIASREEDESRITCGNAVLACLSAGGV
jgi:23S rRNA (adenine2503-C2)-methyltransferase